MIGTDSPENTHPKQESVFHISSPYSHSWKGETKTKNKNRPFWNHIGNFQAMRWSKDSNVCGEKRKHTAPHEFYIYIFERRTPFYVSKFFSQETRQAMKYSSAHSLKRPPHVLLWMLNTRTLTPTGSDYMLASLSEVALAPRDIQFI